MTNLGMNQKPERDLYIKINLQAAAVSLFESSLAQLRSNEDLEGPQCS